MSFTGLLIYDKRSARKNESFINWFLEEADKEALKLKFILREALTFKVESDQVKLLYNNKVIKQPDFVINRSRDLLINDLFESLNITCFNSADIARLNNKALAHVKLTSLGVKSLETYFYSHNSSSLPSLPLPFIIKDVESYGGNDVYLVTSLTEFKHIKSKLKNDFLIQEPAEALGKDLRVFVIGKTIIGSILRENKTDFRANYTLGGTARPYQLNKKELELVKRIIHAFDFDFVGIDFLFSHSGELIFNEIEDVVGSRMLSETTNLNTLNLYVKHIKNTLIADN